ncbi:uncharacterized protein LOC135834647 [Planococcus citri]|uniref:uncharacterized protein LOC135834647 n=1 Tax=Planococcus citri TaxID=170843 RepID=UPI0031F7AF99
MVKMVQMWKQFFNGQIILRYGTTFLLWIIWVLDTAASLLFALALWCFIKNDSDREIQLTEDDTLVQFLYFYYISWSLILVLISVIGVKASHSKETQVFDEIFYHFCLHAFKETFCLLLMFFFTSPFRDIQPYLIYSALLKIGVLIFIATRANNFRNLSKNEPEKKCAPDIPLPESSSYSAVDLLRTDLISTRLWKPTIYVI